MSAALARFCSGRVHYAWVALIRCLHPDLCAIGVRSGPSVMIVPLEQAFGWSAGTISAAISLNILLLGLTGPFITGLMETLGLKRTIMLCLVVLLAGTGLVHVHHRRHGSCSSPGASRRHRLLAPALLACPPR